MSDFLERGVSLYCDLHSAGRIMRMIPVCGYGLHEHHEGDEEMLEVQRAAAVAFGLRSIWSNAHGEDFPAVLKGTSLDGAWLARVPAIYCETTGTGACYEKDVELYSQGIRNLIRHLDIADGPPLEPVGGQRIVEDYTPASGNLQANNVTPVGGLFQSSVTLYDKVAAGDLIGVVTDMFGDVLHECRAPSEGVVICIRHLARVEPMDALATLAPDAGEPED